VREQLQPQSSNPRGPANEKGALEPSQAGFSERSEISAPGECLDIRRVPFPGR